jgi:hypothetical protein
VHPKISLLAALLLAGCGRHSDSRPAKDGSDLTFRTSSFDGASNSPTVSNRQPTKALSDEGEMRVTACEYILTHNLKEGTNETVFISLTNNELKALSARLPHRRFRPPDKSKPGKDSWIDSETGDRGFVLSVYEPVKDVAGANVRLSVKFAGSSQFYSCYFTARPTWTVERIELRFIADSAWPPNSSN